MNTTLAECGRIQSPHDRSSKGKFLQWRCSALGSKRWGQLQINETGVDNSIKSHEKYQNGGRHRYKIEKKSSWRREGVFKAFREGPWRPKAAKPTFSGFCFGSFFMQKSKKCNLKRHGTINVK